jgi:hypothetical protein
VTQGTLSVTSASEVAERYVALRASTGEEYVGALPEDYSRVDCTLSYSARDSGYAEGPLFKAAAMEEKWDIYLYQQRIYLARSWSGLLCYVADVTFRTDNTAEIPTITYMNGLHEEAGMPVKTVDFLIKSHVFGAIVPHPMWGDPETDPQQLAMVSFTLFGRRCWFGTWEDTVPLRWYLSPSHDA